MNDQYELQSQQQKLEELEQMAMDVLEDIWIKINDQYSNWDILKN